MATLETTDDLLRAARENREFREAFRREVLTEALIAVPDQLRELTAVTARLAESGEALTANVNSLVSGMEQMNRDIDEVRTAHRAEHDAMHRFRGNYAIETTRNSDIAIAEKLANALGINRFRVRSLPRDERDDLFDDNMEAIDRLDTEGNISTSLSGGDIIAEVRHRRSRDVIFYIAVEASYTVNSDDIIRASDNAKILAAATGHAAYAIVSGVTPDSRLSDAYKQRISYDLAQYIESEQDNLVLWFQLADRSLEPPPPC